ncbi:hypothetical protein C8R46DRAFT_1043580 [Mycena filopes]|nr:hypothetical protein C8R46DRAFT_1043580 [Mycena filopes]
MFTDTNPAFEEYRDRILLELSYYVFHWIAGLRKTWKMHEHLAFPELPQDYPLSPDFLSNPACNIRTSFEWIHEYRSIGEQIHHSYEVEIGFFGYTLYDNELWPLWGVRSGSAWLAQFEIPPTICDDATFVLHPDLFFTAMLESLGDTAKPIRTVSVFEPVSAIEFESPDGAQWPPPRLWRQNYHLQLRDHPPQQIASRLVQECYQHPWGCNRPAPYPHQDGLPACTTHG